MLSRRDMVGKLAAGAAAVLAAGAARSSFASTRREQDTPAGPALNEAPRAAARLPVSAADGPQVVDAGPPETLSAPPPWQLLRPLQPGMTIAHGWRVAGLSGVVDGSCVLTLQNDRGRAHRIHLCRNDGRPQGLVYTKRFDLIVMNGGQGDLPTEEGLGQAVANVAHVLAANESKPRQEAVVAALLPHAQRLRLYEGPADHRLR